MRTSSSSPSAVPTTRWTAAEALIGRVVRQRLVGELDQVLDALWDASFDLVELAEDGIEWNEPLLRANEVLVAGNRLLRVLGGADELYLALAALCAQLPGQAK